jgi:EamA domain-containing membrane protein RarD
MKTVQALTDKFAIGLSLACTIHCLLLPALLVLLPSIASLQLDNEAFHLWMLVIILPTSIYALSMGCKQHKRYRLFLLGFIGLTLLFLAFILGEERLGEYGEKVVTTIGASFIALGHWFNYRLCNTQNSRNCYCPNTNKTSQQ